MVSLLRVLICFAFFIFYSPVVGASEEQPISVELHIENSTIQPGKPFWALVHLKIDDHQHTYWKNPGDTGFPTAFEFQLPEGFSHTLKWPTPQRFESNDTIGYGYEKEALFLTEIIPPKEAKGSHEIEVSVQFLVCNDSLCLPSQASSKASISISEAEPSLNQKVSDLFKKARSSLPQKQDELGAYTYKDGTIELYFKAPEGVTPKDNELYFIPEDKETIDHKQESSLSQSEESPIDYILTLKTADTKTPQKHLKGILVFNDSSNNAIEFDIPIIHDEEDIAMAHTNAIVINETDSTSQLEGGLIMALGLAFLGGFILNLMPCVLPVISFKVLSFVKLSGQDRSLTLKHGCAFSFGVLASFWFLAILLIILQAYGKTVGWGFQLQEPIFVGSLAVLLFAFGLSLFGVFEAGNFVASLAGKAQNSATVNQETLMSSFLSGILATALATPCTGPFLGSAVGFASSASALSAMLIFTSLGLGMALPYLVLAAYPKLLKFVPKPGQWMDTFKEIVGFIMLATVLWLVWVFNAQTNSLGLLLLLIGLFIVALGCWIFGKWGTPLQSKGSRLFSVIFALCCLSASFYLIYTASSSQAIGSEEIASASSHGKWETFSPERVAELQKQGTPVLIDFTAKWCLVCQANHLALSSKAANKKCEELGIVRMKADWTKGDLTITKELRKFGRNGVPLYLYYDGKSKNPIILPQVLTPELVVDYLY